MIHHIEVVTGGFPSGLYKMTQMLLFDFLHGFRHQWQSSNILEGSGRNSEDLCLGEMTVEKSVLRSFLHFYVQHLMEITTSNILAFLVNTVNQLNFVLSCFSGECHVLAPVQGRHTQSKHSQSTVVIR